ncbi:hypothetical protein [Vibrio rhodolitus]|uniref:hypothetical protein n=1 Tax=Vibrio rhodolitus TaxID=2231649 RepID=UPI000E0C4C0C|nr:hypothetical protein [Vibrio rhodolitus]
MSDLINQLIVIMREYDRKKKIQWLGFLIVIEVIYILNEFALNAALLNAGGGLVLDKAKIDQLEVFGRILSGVGLGLVVFAIRDSKNKKTTDPKKNLVALAGSVGICIPIMFILQTIIIDGLIVGNSTISDRARAQILVNHRVALVTGETDLFSGGASTGHQRTNSETLTVNAVLPLFLLDSESYYNSQYNNRANVAKTFAMTQQQLKKEGMYDAYLEASREIDQQWKQLQTGNMELLKSTPDYVWNDLIKSTQPEFEQYVQAVNKFENGIYRLLNEKKVFRKLDDYFEGAFRSDRCKTQRCKQANLNAITKMMAKVSTDENQTWRDWCSGNTCPASRSDIVAKIALEQEFRFFVLTEMNYGYHHSAEDFLAEVSVAKRIKKKFKAEGINLDSIEYMSRANFTRAYSQAMTGGDIQKLRQGMPKSEFIQLSMIQKVFKSVMGESYKKGVPLGLSKEQFFARYIKPTYQQEVRTQMSLIADAKHDFTKGARVEDGKNYVKSVVVPPIAIALSIIFSVLSISRICIRMFDLYRICNSRSSSTVGQRVTVGFVTLLALLFIPLFGFSLNEQPMRAVKDIHTYDKINKPEALTYIWIVNTQPIIYPLGSTVLKLTGLNNIDHPMYD